MTPFARALHAYHSGDETASFTIQRDDGFAQFVPVSIFFLDREFPPLEIQALDLCRGRVLDAGAAAGRHTLELLRRGREVVSLEILPELESILLERGAAEVIIADITTYRPARKFDTLLMLMNGIGMVGTLDALRRFLRHAPRILAPGGQILCDSIDVRVTSDIRHIAYREQNIARGLLPGQQRFRVRHRDSASASFEWLHIDFAELSIHSAAAGWTTELLAQESTGHYLCRLSPAAAID